MELIRFEKIAGDGPEALYSLYCGGERVADGLTLDEVLTEVTKIEEREAQT